MNLTSGLTDEQMQQMLGNEYGGMNEVMADIYAITGDKKYIERPNDSTTGPCWTR